VKQPVLVPETRLNQLANVSGLLDDEFLKAHGRYSEVAEEQDEEIRAVATMALALHEATELLATMYDDLSALEVGAYDNVAEFLRKWHPDDRRKMEELRYDLLAEYQNR
jgi:hypothetical protein